MVWKTIAYEVGRVQLNPSGEESFGLMSISSSMNQCGILYPRSRGSQFWMWYESGFMLVIIFIFRL